MSYHGFRAKANNFHVDFKTNFDDCVGKVNIVPQDIGKVLLNLFNNAFYAVNDRQMNENRQYKPLVSIETKREKNWVLIKVEDNGKGISPDQVDKIFQPFFTTKPTGEGTGLGLSLAYDIVKAHNGEIEVETVRSDERRKTKEENAGTKFTVRLPLQMAGIINKTGDH